ARRSCCRAPVFPGADRGLARLGADVHRAVGVDPSPLVAGSHCLVPPRASAPLHPLRTGSAVGTPSATNPSSYSPGVVSAIAFCPSPPLLVPELAAGAGGELGPLRAACREAVRRLLAAGPDQVIVIGTGSGGGRVPPGTTGSLGRFGVPGSGALA